MKIFGISDMLNEIIEVCNKGNFREIYGIRLLIDIKSSNKYEIVMLYKGSDILSTEDDVSFYHTYEIFKVTRYDNERHIEKANFDSTISIVDKDIFKHMLFNHMDNIYESNKNDAHKYIKNDIRWDFILTKYKFIDDSFYEFSAEDMEFVNNGININGTGYVKNINVLENSAIYWDIVNRIKDSLKDEILKYEVGSKKCRDIGNEWYVRVVNRIKGSWGVDK